jgi:Na+/melibiose symporter-like transporter
MHFGCLLAGPFVDACTIKYSENEQSYLTQSLSSLSIISIDWTFSGYRMVVFAGLLASFAGLAVALSVREIKMSEVVPSMLQESMKGEGMERTGTPFIPKKEVSPFVPLKGNLWETTKETLSSKKFRGFMVVILVSLNVRLLFRHTDATLPKYMRREFGEDVPFGTIYSIGPLIAIVLVPLISAYTTKVSPLLMILVGMWISAASVFFVAFSTTVWATICFIIVLEIGECVWSPSLYNYAVSASQEGREGM